MPANVRRLDPYKDFKFRVDISSAVRAGKLDRKALSVPRPVRPAGAKAVDARGSVTVFVVVDEDGRVLAARSMDGHPLLRKSATAAARKTRFKPTMLSGQPVKVTGTVTVNFTLQ